MPRIGRIVAVGLPHHITQRGNYQQNVFTDEGDRERYLYWAEKYSIKYSLSIIAYCLMQNHVHFIAIPEKSDSLSRTFNTAHMRYSQYFNKKINQRGHLWQGRFFSCVLDDAHLLLAARYIERNPVRAKLVEKAWEWKWSSALAHIGKGKAFLQLKDLFKVVDMNFVSWKNYLSCPEDNKLLNNIKKHTRAGRPLGPKNFVQSIEKKLVKQ